MTITFSYEHCPWQVHSNVRPPFADFHLRKTILLIPHGASQYRLRKDHCIFALQPRSFIIDLCHAHASCTSNLNYWSRCALLRTMPCDWLYAVRQHGTIVNLTYSLTYPSRRHAEFWVSISSAASQSAELISYSASCRAITRNLHGPLPSKRRHTSVPRQSPQDTTPLSHPAPRQDYFSIYLLAPHRSTCLTLRWLADSLRPQSLPPGLLPTTPPAPIGPSHLTFRRIAHEKSILLQYAPGIGARVRKTTIFALNDAWILHIMVALEYSLFYVWSRCAFATEFLKKQAPRTSTVFAKA